MLDFHEVANLFPMMSDIEFGNLVEDIKANGLLEPIWLHFGKIIDGRNRYKACLAAGVEPKFRTYNGAGEEDLVQFVVSLNLKRRHLEKGQLAFIALEIEAQLAEIGKRRMAEGGGDKKSDNYKSGLEKVPNPIEQNLLDTLTPIHHDKPKDAPAPIKAREQAAEIIGVNDRYVAMAKKIALDAPELAAKVKAGEVSISDASKQLKQQERANDIAEQRLAIASGVATLPDGVFEVISLDPPWPYGTEYDPNGRRAANPYPEMSLEQIKAIELPAANDCILWLWTTHKFMRYSFDLLDAWGFRDVAILTWVKNRMGLGTWLRSQSEFCIMAVKGKPTIELTNQTTVLHGEMREHSRKPESFYEMVDKLCVGRKLDYFSREQRNGWCSFGNDVNKFAG